MDQVRRGRLLLRTNAAGASQPSTCMYLLDPGGGLQYYSSGAAIEQTGIFRVLRGNNVQVDFDFTIAVLHR